MLQAVEHAGFAAAVDSVVVAVGAAAAADVVAVSVVTTAG